MTDHRSTLPFSALRLTAALILIALAAARPAAADFDAGLTAYNRGEFATAAAEWEPLAEAGHARAQFRMGILHANGDGVPRDLRKSTDYYRKAAEQGLPNAQNALAFVYRVGNGVPASYEEAFKWYLLDADAGVAEAQFNLGSLYAGGRGTQRDFVEGYKWLSIAAAQSVEEARQAIFYCADQMTDEQVTEAQRRANEWRPRE